MLAIEVWTTIATDDAELLDKSLKVINNVSLPLA